MENIILLLYALLTYTICIYRFICLIYPLQVHKQRQTLSQEDSHTEGQLEASSSSVLCLAASQDANKIWKTF